MVVSFRQEHDTSQLYSVKWSVVKTSIQVKLYKMNQMNQFCSAVCVWGGAYVHPMIIGYDLKQSLGYIGNL